MWHVIKNNKADNIVKITNLPQNKQATSNNAEEPGEVLQKNVDETVKPSASLCSSAKIQTIQAGLETTLSVEEKQHLQSILDSVEKLTDVQKLLLYLKLPTGGATYASQDSGGNAPGKRDREQYALTWLRTHLDADKKTCIPKQKVYEEYKSFCMRHGYAFVSSVEFGKLVKFVFPQMNTRRLGQRGQSKHCFGALARKAVLDAPSLPDVKVESHVDDKPNPPSSDAACSIVCEWAQRLLGQNFTAISRLADYLVSNNYVNGRSTAAFSVLAEQQKVDIITPAGSEMGDGGTTTQTWDTTARPRDVQLRLQRALQLRKQKTLLAGDVANEPPEVEQSVTTVEEVREPPPAKQPSAKPSKPSLPKLILPKLAATTTANLNSPTNQPLLVISGSTAWTGSNIQMVSNMPSGSGVPTASSVPTRSRIPSGSSARTDHAEVLAPSGHGRLAFVVQSGQIDDSVNSAVSQVAVNHLSQSSQNMVPVIEQQALQAGHSTYQVDELRNNVVPNVNDAQSKVQQTAELASQINNNELPLSPGHLLRPGLYQTTATAGNEMMQSDVVAIVAGQPQPFITDMPRGDTLNAFGNADQNTADAAIHQGATMSPVFRQDIQHDAILSPVLENAILQSRGDIPRRVSVQSPNSSLQTKTGSGKSRPSSTSATVSALLRNKRGYSVVKPVEVCDMRPVSQLLSESRRARNIQQQGAALQSHHPEIVTGVQEMINNQGNLIPINDDPRPINSQEPTAFQTTTTPSDTWTCVVPAIQNSASTQNVLSQHAAQDGQCMQTDMQSVYPAQVLPNMQSAVPWQSYVQSALPIQTQALCVQNMAPAKTPTYTQSPVLIRSAPYVPNSAVEIQSHDALTVQSPLHVQNAVQSPLNVPTAGPMQSSYTGDVPQCTTISPLSVPTNDESPNKLPIGEISSTDESSSQSLMIADEGLSEMTWPTRGAEPCVLSVLSPESQRSRTSTPLLSPPLLLQPAGFTPIRPDADHTRSPLPHAQHAQHAQPSTKHRGFVPYQRMLPLIRQPFALASGIRPVKRGRAALPSGQALMVNGSKRVRRHSAQSGLQPKYAAAIPMNALLLTNQAGCKTCNQTDGQASEHRHTTEGSSTAVESHIDVNITDNLSPDPLTFSPEIHDIISCGSGPAADAQYRSHSVPALLRSLPITEQLDFSGDMEASLEGLLDDMGELYQREKAAGMSQEPFAARKNLTQFLTTPLASAMRLGRGDHMISGASLRRSARLFSDTHQTNMSAPTPPASHNNTPVEFADEITPDIAPTLTQTGHAPGKTHWALEEN